MVDDVESLIVIDEPELSIAVFNSLIAATNDVFCVVVNDDKSAVFPLTSVLIDLHSVANLVARSAILAAKVDIDQPQINLLSKMSVKSGKSSP